MGARGKMGREGIALVLSCGQRVPKGVRLYRACSARADLYITDI